MFKKALIFILIVLLIPVSMSGCRFAETDYSNTTDNLYKEKVKNYQFVMVKVSDDFITAENYYRPVHFKDNSRPEMSNGEFALVNANVTLYTGGIAGYKNEPFIDKLKSYEIISIDEAAEKSGIPEIDETNYASRSHVKMYHSGNDVYCIIFYKGKDQVYLNNEYKAEYEDLNKIESFSEYVEIITGQN